MSKQNPNEQKQLEEAFKSVMDSHNLNLDQNNDASVYHEEFIEQTDGQNIDEEVECK